MLKRSLFDGAKLLNRPWPILLFQDFLTKEEARAAAAEASALPLDAFEPFHRSGSLQPDGSYARHFKMLARGEGAVSEAFTRELFAQLGVKHEGPVFPEVALMRDLPGFFISPHPDKPEKLATLQLYLPADDSQKGLGTCFYSDEGRALALKLLFSPNTGYAFKVTKDSWHGVQRIPPGSAPRHSLLIVWYTKPDEGLERSL